MDFKKFVRFEKEGIESVIRHRREESLLFNDKVNRRITLSPAHSEMINFATMGVELIAEDFTGIDGKLDEHNSIFFESKMLSSDKEGNLVVKVSLNKKNKKYYEKYKSYLIVGVWDPHKGALAFTLVGKLNLLKDDYDSKCHDIINNNRISTTMDVNISKLINKGFLVFSVNYAPNEVFNMIKDKSDTSLNSNFGVNHIIPIEYFDKKYYLAS